MKRLTLFFTFLFLSLPSYSADIEGESGIGEIPPLNPSARTVRWADGDLEAQREEKLEDKRTQTCRISCCDLFSPGCNSRKVVSVGFGLAVSSAVVYVIVLAANGAL